jgi:hypothetical protein
VLVLAEYKCKDCVHMLSTVSLVCSGKHSFLFKPATVCLFIFYQLPRHSIEINTWRTFIKFPILSTTFIYSKNMTWHPFMNPDCSSNSMHAHRSGRVICNTMEIQWKIKGTDIFSHKRGMWPTCECLQSAGRQPKFCPLLHIGIHNSGTLQLLHTLLVNDASYAQQT